MVEVGGETTAEGEICKSKSKANDREEDTKLENFAEGIHTIYAIIMMHFVSKYILYALHVVVPHITE